MYWLHAESIYDIQDLFAQVEWNEVVTFYVIHNYAFLFRHESLIGGAVVVSREIESICGWSHGLE